MDKKKHYDLIIAWANGAQIEWFDRLQDMWQVMHSPGFYDKQEYRIVKNKVKKTVYGVYWPRDNRFSIDGVSEKQAIGLASKLPGAFAFPLEFEVDE